MPDQLKEFCPTCYLITLPTLPFLNQIRLDSLHVHQTRKNIFKQIKNLRFLEIYAVFVWGEHSAKDLAWGENWQIVWIFMQPAFSYCRQSLQVELSNFNLTLLWQWTLHLEILDMLSRLALEHLFNVTLILLVAFCVDYFQRCRNWTLGGCKDAGHS